MTVVIKGKPGCGSRLWDFFFCTFLAIVNVKKKNAYLKFTLTNASRKYSQVVVHGPDLMVLLCRCVRGQETFWYVTATVMEPFTHSVLVCLQRPGEHFSANSAPPVSESVVFLSWL